MVNLPMKTSMWLNRPVKCDCVLPLHLRTFLPRKQSLLTPPLSRDSGHFKPRAYKKTTGA